MLGEYGCGGTWCLALAHSIDAGGHFARVGLPPFPTQGTNPTLEFANARDGYAYVPFAGPLYATHDGGKSWHRAGPIGHVVAFAVGGGKVYLVTTRHQLERSPVSHEAWVGLRRARVAVSLAVRGSHVWLLGGPRRKPDFDSLARSGDDGRTFATGEAPCFFELGGRVVPAGRGIVWAVCPTGMMGGVWLSTNGGRSFPAPRSSHDPGGLPLPQLMNGAEIFPSSPSSAVLYNGVKGPLFRTTDTGARWTPLRQTAHINQLLWLRFATSRIGAAVFSTRSHPNRARLWRTTDGGATWHAVPLS